MTNSFSAEYGLTMGSQMTIVTKSGTNQFHGDAFEYLRNSVLDARNYFDVLYSLPTSSRAEGSVSPRSGGISSGEPAVRSRRTRHFSSAPTRASVSSWDNPPNLGVTPTFPAACHVTPVVTGKSKWWPAPATQNLKEARREQVPFIVADPESMAESRTLNRGINSLTWPPR